MSGVFESPNALSMAAEILYNVRKNRPLKTILKYDRASGNASIGI